MEHIISKLHKQFIVKISLYSACILSIILLAFTIWQYQCNKSNLAKHDQEFAFTITQKAAQKITQVTHALTTIVDTLAHDLSEGTIAHDKVIEQLSRKLPTMYGMGVAFLPYAYNKDKKLFAPYLVDTHKTPELLYLENFVDYSNPSNQRFAKTLSDGPTWHNPFWDEATKRLILEYSVPFYDKNHQKIGIVFGSYTIDYIQELVQSLYPSNFGYGALVRKDGTLISHPNIEYIGRSKTELEIAHDLKNFRLESDLKKAFNGEINMTYESTNFLSGQDSLLIFEPIPSTDWFTKGVFVLSEFETKTLLLQRQFINIIMSLMLFLLLLLLVVMRVYMPTAVKAWCASATASVALLIIIAFMWYGLFSTPINEPKIVENTFDLAKIIHEFNPDKSTIKGQSLQVIQEASGKKSIAGFTLIPTGIYIHEVRINVDTITLNGYVWQQIPITEQQHITPGITFPQAREISMEEAYRIVKGDVLIIGWAMRASLVQNFNFFNYPLDFKRIRIQLWPKHFDEKIILIPDFNGYKAFNPTALPGLNKKIQLTSWTLEQSYFSYQKENPLINFGYHPPQSYTFDNNQNPIETPQFYFNIITSRKAVGPLALSLMPIIIILVLLFILLLMSGTIEFQFMFGSIASLFFTSLIAYTAFKTYLSIQNVIFLDYIYFLLQGSILIIAVMGILYHKQFKIPLLEHKKMLIPQLFFWPLIMGGVLILSLIFFY